MISGAEDEDGDDDDDDDDGAEEDDDAEPRRERTFVPVHTEEKRPSSLSATLITDSFESRHRVVVEVEVDGWVGGEGDGVLVYSKWRTRLRLRLTQTSPCVERRAELCPSRRCAYQTGGSGEEPSAVR